MGNKTLEHFQEMYRQEHDENASRKKVSTWIYNNSVSYEDTNFVTGDSPATLNVYSDLGVTGHLGYITNDGDGNILIELSNDGTNYGGQHTLKSYETAHFNEMTVYKIRLTWVSDTSYRVFVA